ncbi:MAG: bifunctional oligoribonuclease/PAP phosphatase NrnA, partial [Bacilli bacterium]|nr:bifunctional oligoribonuclease/PAP phosphatase NrnA [Bacilli bacterium]
DAYGSQFGLYYALKDFFPDKQFYVIGDTNPLNLFQEFDIVDEEFARKSLLIILDTVAAQMLDPKTYEHYDKLILIDHHRNDADIDYDLAYQVMDASSTAEIVADLLLHWEIPITYDSARALYLGIIGDTGRFMYNSTTEKTLYIASKLVGIGINIQELHNSIYLEPKKNKEIKTLFFQRVQYTDNDVAYVKNDKEFINQYGLTSNYVSRGLVNQMAGITEVPIWVNFTEDLNTGNIWCEIRSRGVPVLDVAKKYGGGGHLNACGCTLSQWSDTDKVISDLNELLKEK